MCEDLLSRIHLVLALLGIECAYHGEILMSHQLPPFVRQALGVGTPTAVRGLNLNIAMMDGLRLEEGQVGVVGCTKTGRTYEGAVSPLAHVVSGEDHHGRMHRLLWAIMDQPQSVPLRDDGRWQAHLAQETIAIITEPDQRHLNLVIPLSAGDNSVLVIKE